MKYTYCINGTDPDGDFIYVFWDWGDGTNTGWLGPYPSGEEICASHTWTKKGTYTITVTLKDEHGATVTASLEVTMPRNKAYINIPFLNFLQSHPNLFPILQMLLQRLRL